MTRFVNLTAKPLTIEGAGTIQPSGSTARVRMLRQRLHAVHGVGVTKLIRQGVTGLPAPQAGTAYIVPTLVLNALEGARSDVYAPDTGHGATRSGGNVVRVSGLIQ